MMKGCIIDEYACKFKRKDSFKCSHRLIVETNDKTGRIIIKKSIDEHNHWEKCDLSLSDDKKRIIYECSDLNISPALIQDQLKASLI